MIASPRPALSPPDLALTDVEIIERVRRGDVGLYEILMRRHNQRLYRVVRGLISDEIEVEDVMQQAYVSAFAHLEQYAERAMFSTWLCRIGLNEALARIRRGRREPLRALEPGHDGEDPAEPAAPPAASPEEAASRSELAALLEAAIAGLPEIYRLVFILREVEEMSTAESAECLGVSEEVIRVRLHRARHLLREALGREAGGEASEALQFRAPRCDRVVAGVFARLALER